MTGNVGLDSTVSNHPSQLSQPSNSMEVLDAIAQNNLAPGTGGTIAGNVIVSPFGELIVSLIQVQMENAEVFKETAARAAVRLQDEAHQQAQAESKQFLTKVANALQQAAQTGELPPLPSQLTTSIQAYTRAGLPVTTNAITDVPTDSMSISLSQLFASIVSQVKAAQTS
jgi:hypothetical protein